MNFFDVILVGIFVIRLFYRTFKVKLKNKVHHLFKLGCIMIVYEIVMESGMN